MGNISEDSLCKLSCFSGKISKFKFTFADVLNFNLIPQQLINNLQDLNQTHVNLHLNQVL